MKLKSKLYHQVKNSTTSIFSAYYYTGNSQHGNDAHFHKNYEIINVIEGICTVYYKNTEFILNKGDMIFVEPFVAHSIVPSEDSEVRSSVFSKNLIYSLSNYIEGYRAVSPLFHPGTSIIDYYNSELTRCFGKSTSVNERLSAEMTVIVKGCLYAVGGEFMRLAELVPTEKHSDTLIQEVIDHIAKNYLSNLSLRDIANKLGYSYHYVSRLFNNALGISFKFLLNLYRAEYAVALLEDTRMPIGEIAFKSGFQNVRSFNEHCKSMYGKTPREIRKIAQLIV